jgi:hypothetical protein
MYGPNDDLDIAWSGVGNVRVQQVVQQDILTELGLNKLLPD